MSDGTRTERSVPNNAPAKCNDLNHSMLEKMSGFKYCPWCGICLSDTLSGKFNLKVGKAASERIGKEVK